MSSFRRVLVLSLIAMTAAAIGCSNDVKVGAIISETGAVATYGNSVRKGIDLALDEINAAGGYKGGTFTVVYRDDATMPDIGTQVAHELIEQEQVDYIIGAVSSPVTLEIAPICEEVGVVLLSPSASAPAISDAGDFIFRNYPSDILEGTVDGPVRQGPGLREGRDLRRRQCVWQGAHRRVHRRIREQVPQSRRDVHLPRHAEVRFHGGDRRGQGPRTGRHLHHHVYRRSRRLADRDRPDRLFGRP